MEQRVYKLCHPVQGKDNMIGIYFLGNVHRKDW
jgi:hypothetical protein